MSHVSQARVLRANLAVDAVVRHHLQKAQQAGAETDVKIDLPAGSAFLMLTSVSCRATFF